MFEHVWIIIPGKGVKPKCIGNHQPATHQLQTWVLNHKGGQQALSQLGHMMEYDESIFEFIINAKNKHIKSNRTMM